MDEYIKRDAVIQKAFSTGLCDANGNMYGAGDVVLVDDVLSIPAADVASVAYGRWINAHISGVHHYRCSKCGEYMEATWFANFEYKFCPNCGSRMEQL